MTLQEAQEEIKRLNALIAEKDAQIEELKAKKNAGRPPHNAKWQASYDSFAKMYESGMNMAEIVEKSDCSRRTCYRYKAYYDALKKGTK